MHDETYCPEEIWGDLEGPLEDGKVHGTFICEVNQDAPNWRDNARLIAAAPDMLAALKALASNSQFRSSYYRTVLMIDEIIAKAEGK